MNKILVSGILLMIIILTGCLGGCTVEDAGTSAEITFPVTMTETATGEVAIDAYCTYDEELPYFYFNITLENTTSEDMEVTYIWTVNYTYWDFYGEDYSIGYLMNKTQARLYEGQGSASLNAMETSEAVIKIQQRRDSDYGDTRWHTMHIAVYCGDTLVGYYRQQKAPTDFDYNVIPPVQTYTRTVPDY
jgi:hypothetical protein